MKKYFAFKVSAVLIKFLLVASPLFSASLAYSNTQDFTDNEIDLDKLLEELIECASGGFSCSIPNPE